MGNTTPYILEKDSVYYSFTSEKSACEYLGLPPCRLADVMRRDGYYAGYIEDAVNRPVRQRTRGYRPSGCAMVEEQGENTK